MGWDLVGHPEGHPVPGDAPAVDEQAAHLARVARTLRDQASRLRAIEHMEPVWQSDAADTFQKRIAGLPDDLDTAAVRYEKVSRAVGTFAAAMGPSKVEAEAGVAEAEAAQAEIDQASADLARQRDWERDAQRAADD